MDLMNLLRTQWDRAIAVLAAIGGAVALVIGWIGVSGTPNVAKQLPYVISSGLTGIFLLGIAAVLWLTADLRDEWRELRRVGNLLDRELTDRQAERAAAGTHGRP
ncbi:MAG: hypothetical protein ACT4PP_15565 [Sporichthyaceae bacterium]